MTEARGGYHWPGSLGGREAGVMTGVAQRAATTGRRGRLGSGRLSTGGGAGFVLAACAALVLMVPAEASVAGRARLVGGPDRVRVGPVLEVSRGCKGQNAEVEQAVDYPYVYEAWMGCRGIGFARSTDGGRTFGPPLRVPGSAGHGLFRVGRYSLRTIGWDPAVAVAPDGTVYVSYMTIRHDYMHPVVAVLVDHGARFTRIAQVMPPAHPTVNWGDRDFIAVAPDGTIYLTWGYGPSARQTLNGHGHANAVIQKSVNGRRTWSRITHVSPGYPDGIVNAAPLLVEPGGRIDVLMWSADHDSRTSHDYFTSSADGGRTWSAPVVVRPGAGQITGAFWIDAALASTRPGSCTPRGTPSAPAGTSAGCPTPPITAGPGHPPAGSPRTTTVPSTSWRSPAAVLAPPTWAGSRTTTTAGSLSTYGRSRCAAAGSRHRSGCPASSATAPSGRATP